MKRLLLLLLFVGRAAVAADVASVHSHTRETDYTIGSVARQTIVIETPPGYRLDEGSLPEKGQTEAIELRDMHWTYREGKNLTRHTLVLDWQVFVASETVRPYPLKALQLVFKRQGQQLNVPVKADSVIVSNLLPAHIDDTHVKPYPDVQPQAIPTRLLRITFMTSLLGLLTGCVYFAWRMGWISLRNESALPFRQSWKMIRHLRKTRNDAHRQDEVLVKQAMQSLSRAYDTYAGYAVSVERLPSLFIHRPALQAHESATCEFYREAQYTFFEGSAPKLGLAQLEQLSHRLSKLEMP